MSTRSGDPRKRAAAAARERLSFWQKKNVQIASLSLMGLTTGGVSLAGLFPVFAPQVDADWAFYLLTSLILTVVLLIAMTYLLEGLARVKRKKMSGRERIQRTGVALAVGGLILTLMASAAGINQEAPSEDTSIPASPELTRNSP